MAKPIIAVFGATGNQGNSVAHFILDSAHLSTQYTVRAISRDTQNPKMGALAAKGAQLAQADLDDLASLAVALESASYMFLVTTTPPAYARARALETMQAKNACSAALDAGVRYIIFSSMSHPAALSQGALTHAVHFDVKAEIEAYIRSLPVQSAFFAPASFMQNLTGRSAPRPAQEGSGADYVMVDMLPGDARVPYIDVT